MSLLQQAAEYVQGSASKQQQYDLLMRCIEAGTLEALLSVQLLYEDMYGGFTYNYELKITPANCLVFWGEQGLTALVEAAVRTPTTKNVSITLQVLASIASGGGPPFTFGFAESPLLERLRAEFARHPGLAQSAKRKLNEYLLSLPDEDAAASAVGLNLMMAVDDTAAAKQLVTSLATRWLAVSPQTIQRYEGLLLTHADDEATFQKFFEDYPQLLDPMAFQVWPRPNLRGVKEPDFVIRRRDDSYLIVEIEKPSKQLVTAALQVSADVTQAVTQAMQYRRFLVERFRDAAQSFPNFQDPETLVVIGLESTLSDGQREALVLDNQHRSGVRVVGFDWIARRAEAITQNVIASEISVQELRMT